MNDAPNADICPICGADEFRMELLSDCFEVEGQNVIVENIPVRVCLRCGDMVFSAETTERVRELLHGGGAPIRTETLSVFDYA